MTDSEFLAQAIALARRNAEKGGRPFGAVVVRDGKIVGEGVNQMSELHDPTAHAELLALRHAGNHLRQTRLEDCVVYASGQPCPMCLAAMRMAGVPRAVYAYSNADAEPYGLSTASIALALRQIRMNSRASLLHSKNRKVRRHCMISGSKNRTDYS